MSIASGTSSTPSTTSYGVYGLAAGLSGTLIGTAGFTNGNSTNRYGVFGQSNGVGAGVWAGFFSGNIFTSGTITQASDERLKKNVQEENALTKVLMLRPVSYSFNETSIKMLNLPNTFQHGFIAQELEKIFPEIVADVNVPMFTNSGNSGTNKVSRTEVLKGINYIAIIPILTKAIQEQQQIINTLNKRIDNLALTNSEKIRNTKGYSLAQNIPNPFTSYTTITYSLPANTGNALLGVLDLNGKMLMQYNLAKAGNQITINGNTLAAGIYIYSLIVNGSEVVSKKMVLTK